MKLTFQNETDGIVLRDFLRSKQVSAALRAAIKRNGGFYCNGRPIFTNQRLAAGQTVSFDLPPDEPGAVQAQDLPLDIVYEDAHMMVLNKPSGITVHPTRGYADGTLANAFMGLMARRGMRATFRPINRLDREVSGLVLCAMNAWAAPVLAKSARKEYLALASGEMPWGAGVFNWPIGLADGSLIQRACRADGKPSRTEYRVLRATSEASLAMCVTVTGRTHQIRVHFAHAGHPLLGDHLYGGNLAQIDRVALHCRCIRVKLPDVAMRTVTAPPPGDMKALIFHLFSDRL